MPNHPNATMSTIAGAVSVLTVFLATKVGLTFDSPEQAALIGGAIATIVSGVALFLQGPKPSA